MAMVRHFCNMLLGCGLLMVGLTGCSSDSIQETGFTGEHPVISVAMAMEPTDQGERLHLVWVEKPPEGASKAWHRMRDETGEHWSEPVPIITGQAAPDRARRDNDLQLVITEGVLVVAWQSRGDGFMGAGPMVMARSQDQGKSWQPATPAASQEQAQAHGFFDLSLDPAGQLHMAWLDNRTGQQGLHHAISGDQGNSWSSTETLVPATCYCCWNSLHHQQDNSYLLYRGHEPRDMGLLQQGEDGMWQDQGRVGAFDWQFHGCPHVGGALASLPEDGSLHALVWTGEEQQRGLYHLSRASDSKTFSTPRTLGSRAARHADLAATPEGLLAVWDEPDQGTINLARLENGTFSPPQVLRQEPERNPQRPLIISSDTAIHILWTEISPPGQTGWVLRTLTPD
ncbi:MAG: exo-alpha-sialidase [Halomonadaceae bacterium]|nr:MAG: exo-alpha-sialidase [Halomonadaceae bacterium]